MGRRGLWLAVGGAIAAAGAAAAMHPVTVLEVENAARRRTFRFPVGAGQTFQVTSWHSMYDQPVTEEFAIDERGRIALQAVSSPSAAVREYFGIAAAGERHQVRRAMPEVVFRVATGEPQRLGIAGVERPFLGLGDRGDRLVMRASRRPALAQLLHSGAGAAP